MKLLKSLFIFLPFFGFGQITIGENGVLSDEAIVRLKNTKTIFVYKKSDEVYLDELESELKIAWKVNDLQIMSYEDYLSFDEKNEEYSYLTLDAKSTEYSMSSGGIYYKTYIYLVLWQNINSNDSEVIAKIDLFPEYSTILKVQDIMFKGSKTNYIELLYNEGKIKNWNVGYLKNQLQMLSNIMEKNRRYFISNYPEVKELTNDILYIPESATYKFNKFTGDESNKHDMDKLMKKYPYKYKVIKDNELSKLILSSETPIYYLWYVKSCVTKYFSVVNSINADIIYNSIDDISYNLDDKDFLTIIKEIQNY